MREICSYAALWKPPELFILLLEDSSPLNISLQNPSFDRTIIVVEPHTIQLYTDEPPRFASLFATSMAESRTTNQAEHVGKTDDGSEAVELTV